MFDQAQDKKEDSWLLSPGINFTEAGSYVLAIDYVARGTLEFWLGTDLEDLSSFTREVGRMDGENFTAREYVFEVSTPGVYYLGSHACAESGTNYGYMINSLQIKKFFKAPECIADLAIVSGESPAQATLSATYPDKYNTGEALDAIGKAEILRDGEVIETITTPLPGSRLEYVDTPAPGTYTYSVLVYGVDGQLSDKTPMKVKSAYLGKPVVTIDEMNYTVSEMSDDSKSKWFLDGWVFDDGGYPASVKSTNTNSGNPDNWCATPYVYLAAGNYRLDMTIGGFHNGYRVGLTKARLEKGDNFSQLYEETYDAGYGPSEKNLVFTVEEGGEYALAFHHNMSQSYKFNTVELTALKLSVQLELPAAVQNLKGEITADGTQAILSWTNPTLNNSGSEFSGQTMTLTVRRDGEVLAALEGCPGQHMTYTDITVPDTGIHRYSVETSGANGPQEEAVPEMELNFARPVEFPYQADFSEWTFPDYGSWWEIVDGNLYYRESPWLYGETAVTPLMEFEENMCYAVTIVFENAAAGVDLKFGSDVNGKSNPLIYQFDTPATTDETVAEICLSVSSATEQVTAANDLRQTPVVAMAPGRGYLSLEKNALGQTNISSFRIEKTAVNPSGTGKLSGEDGMEYDGSFVTVPAGMLSYEVYDLSGRMLESGRDTQKIDLRAYRGVLVVKASGEHSTVMMKVCR